MATRYNTTFTFVNTEEEAKSLCNDIYKAMKPYARRKHKPHYTAWESTDHKEHKFVVWYVR